MSTTPEPAIRSYFFGKGYRDLWSTIGTSWSLNWEAARKRFGAAGVFSSDDLWGTAQSIVMITAGVSVVLFGTVVFILASAVHITVLFTFFALIYLGFTIVYLSERAYLLGKQYFTVCPHCHEKYPLPEYYCRKCGEIHKRLIPSSYGILHHLCKCGERLPATFFLQRSELKARCANPDCNQLLEKSHTMESRKAFVPIVGGPSVGKSAFMFSAVQCLIDEKAAAMGLSTSFVESQSESEFERAREQLARGRAPDKTLDSLPRAFNLELNGRGSPRLLYLYDPAGEAYLDSSDLVLHRFQGYLSGMIFLIDPFSIPAVREHYGRRLTAVTTELKPSQLPIEDALSRVLISMEQNFRLGKIGRVRKPMAVVINKIDALGLEKALGEKAVTDRVVATPEKIDHQTARNQLIREQLIRWDQGDLVQQLESRFAKVAYFTCSALGRMPDSSGDPFKARGIMEPLMWILADTDRVFVED